MLPAITRFLLSLSEQFPETRYPTFPVGMTVKERSGCDVRRVIEPFTVRWVVLPVTVLAAGLQLVVLGLRLKLYDPSLLRPPTSVMRSRTLKS